jgi:GntR family transcriptional regulator, histidine utilization repressor
MSEAAPLYVKVKKHILGHIHSGRWKPGRRVPSENEIVRQFRISRMTAHRAMRELTSDGYLERLPGVGTFVREPTVGSSLIELRNIADEIAARGHAHIAREVSRKTLRASGDLAGEFEMAPGARIFHLVLVHEEDGTPVQYEDRYVNAAAVPDFFDQDFRRVTPTAHLLRSVPVDELEHTVKAVRPAKQVAQALHVRAGEACLALHRRSWSGGRVVSVATLTYPGERASLRSRYRTTAFGTLRQ